MLSIFYPSTNEISRYTLEKKNNPTLQSNVSSEILGRKIKLNVPYGTQTDGLIASYDTTAKSVWVKDVPQQSGITSNDFTNALTYQTVAPDNTLALYEASVELGKEYSKEMKVFGFSKKYNPSIVDDTKGVFIGYNINVILPYGSFGSDGPESKQRRLIASYITSGKNVFSGGIEQSSEETINDFSALKTYKVTATDGSFAEYNVTVSIAAESAKELLDFMFTKDANPNLPNNYQANITDNNITATFPSGTNVSSLTPSFITSGQKVEVDGIKQRSNFTSNNFSNAVTYTVTAADKSVKNYYVTVSITNDSITSFSFDNPPATGIIYGSNILLTVPFGTDLTRLTPTVFHTGILLTPESGVSQNFSTPVLYTVTAQDGTTQTYTVNVIVADATVTTPTFSVNGGSYTNDQTVSITCTTAGAAIYYTTDGNLPSTASTLYTTPVVLSGSGYKTLRAIAVKNGMLDSGIKTESYYIQPLTVSYAGSPFTFTNGTAITEKLPTASKTVATYSITPSLPNGMTFNTTTGGIGGTPTVEDSVRTYTITATKADETATTTIKINVRICYDWGCFEDKGNGTVTFTGTGMGAGYDYSTTNLTFMKCSQGQMWDATTNGCDGSSYIYNTYTTICNDLVFADKIDWRVPEISELKTLIHCTDKTMPSSGCGNYNSPTINKLFIGIIASSYWSSTLYDVNYAFFVGFNVGNINYYGRDQGSYIRCVRTGL